MAKSLPNRSEVDIKHTWNLQDLFQSEEEYHSSLETLQQEVTAFAKKYEGVVGNEEHTLQAVKVYEAIYKQIVPLQHYTSLSLSEDQANDTAQMRANQFSNIISKISSQLSFLKSELIELPVDRLEQLQQEAPELLKFIRQLILEKPHALHPEAEKALAAFSATFQAPYSLYNTTKLVDLSFDNFEVDGDSFPLSYTAFEGSLETEANTATRRAAYAAFYEQLKQYEHTTAKTYDMHIQAEKTNADLRGYDSVFDYLLQSQEVDRSLYNRQIDLIMSELAPHMRKYAKLLKRIYGLDQMTFADLKVPIDAEYEPTITIEQSKQYILDGLSIMGDDYVQMIKRAYGERWIDFVQNKGKSTGAFCASPYGNHSYILISWSGSMEDVFVLAHELGHAGHFYHANQTQSIFNARSSLYFVEAPSTLNEMLVANHLLANTEDLRLKRWVIASIVSRTYYHNFVTHLLEADYQRKVYELIDAGGSVNANVLNTLKRESLERFWGEDVLITEGAERTWMRQPHYYMGLYPYTYSAGLTISTEMSARILKEGKPAVDDWLRVLQAGGTKSPVELAGMANIDISTEQPLRSTIAYIGQLIDELVMLTDQLENN